MGTGLGYALVRTIAGAASGVLVCTASAADFLNYRAGWNGANISTGEYAGWAALPDYTWTLTTGGAGSYTATKPIVPGDGLINDAVVNYQSDAIAWAGHGSASGNGTISIPAAGPVSPSRVFTFSTHGQLQFEPQIWGPISASNIRGEFLFTGVTPSAPLYYALSWSHRLNVGDGAVWSSAEFTFAGAPQDPSIIWNWMTPFGYTIRRSLNVAPGSSIEESGTSHGQWDGTSPLWANVFWRLEDSAGVGGSATIDTNVRIAFSDSPILAVPAVPEPETYAMLLAGLGLIGWRLRDRKHRQDAEELAGGDGPKRRPAGSAGCAAVARARTDPP